jgi:hypothetical protein
VDLLRSEFDNVKNINFFRAFIKFENNLRINILKTMLSRYGKDWWITKVNRSISEICIKRALHDNNKFHYIFYSDLSDVKRIIKDNWDDLRELFKNNDDIFEKIDKINKKRNLIFHGRFDVVN